MLRVTIANNRIRIGRYFSVSFQRTLRIPDDGNTYPLPPGLGRFPICRVADYKNKVPHGWKDHGGVFIPMYQREALWLSFAGAYWHPCAVKIGIGKINALSGKRWKEALAQGKQDYLVCPDQPWLDGIKAGEGFIRQFVAMPLGMGYTVEGQLTGKEEYGGMRIMVFNAKPGRFPLNPPGPKRPWFDGLIAGLQPPMACACKEMGLASGGKMKQKVYEDSHGSKTWAQDDFGRVYVHIVNSETYKEITGKEPPSTPISAKTYTEYGFPWFELYEQEKADITASSELAGVKSVMQMDEQSGGSSQQDDSTIDISFVKHLGGPETDVKDGKW